ncbi:dual specificity protein phosphatase family protein [Rhizobium laguerreae]|uniref:dual specificity protein phosphatase family protein n=1 Tax=Rhizobium laguerreae TaxID=1076926 RepID=UPI00144189EF|nr:dual specificity protein phosphatase family protein [Rhizobium laguerreae]MBY3278229.1 dual specificity protein phosphatase family protein [Rhizobium laguerreae]NKM38553.1 hypothetical protein [Rhizobium laguerreae]
MKFRWSNSTFTVPILAFGFACCATASVAVADPLGDSIVQYKARFPLPNTHAKLVNNHGDGFEDLRGVRNFRAVLGGVMYRGGANNDYRVPKLGTHNPLPKEGLSNLCQEGFSTAIYLYSTNYEDANHTITCKTRDGKENTLSYLQISPLTGGEKAQRALLTEIHRHLGAQSTHPVYTHCWNGWHGSGFISALALRQFCGISAEAAISYWTQNTDGNEHVANAKFIHKAITEFKSIPELAIPDSVRDEICPPM